MKSKLFSTRGKKAFVSLCVTASIMSFSSVGVLASPAGGLSLPGLNITISSDTEIGFGNTVSSAPVITGQPIGMTVAQYSEATLSITAESPRGTLSYQWFETTSRTRPGTAVDGATDRVFKVPTEVAETKYYYCTVTNTNSGIFSNGAESVQSDAAYVSVRTAAEPPRITKQPADVKTFTNLGAQLTVEAKVSKGNLSYQWYVANKNTDYIGTPIPGATAATVNAPTTTNGIQYYYCVVTNRDQNASMNRTVHTFSNIVTVEVLARPSIGGQLGADIVWTLDLTTGSLRIHGSGDMSDWTSISISAILNAPWIEYMGDIKNVQIFSNETEIAVFGF